MKILLIEDSLEKKNAIETIITQELNQSIVQAHISYADNLITARRELFNTKFDLIIFDMYLPDNDVTATERDCSHELITEFLAGKNYQTDAITLTQFKVSQIENIKSFNLAGITLVHYQPSSQDWIVALQQKLNRAEQIFRCDFLIFCALTKERNAFKDCECKIGEHQNISNMNCIEITIGDSNGLIIKPSKMGLVNMAITSSKAIELFQPKIVAMSGICAGVDGESNYLDIIVGEVCWEYQTGKWQNGEFKQEPYQATLSQQLQVDLEQSTECKNTLEAIRENLFNTELGNMKVKLAPISSGSAVIADEIIMEKIELQHRKMAGLEMEMYSLYEAATQSLCKPLCFGAKAVVDMGDSSKGDTFHETGCTISARYTALMLQEQLKKLAL